jgi:type VI secretion system protein ImpC
MAGRMEFEFQFGGAKKTPSFGPGAPLRVLLLGDFGGRGARGVVEGDLARRPLLRVDAGGLDALMQRLGPRLVVTPPVDDRAPDAIAFGSLDDFHPDRLCARLEVFAGFRVLRERLLDSSTFARTADALEPPPVPAAQDDTLSRLLGGRRQESGPDIGAFLKQVVAPHITPAPDARQPRLVAAVDEAASHHLRGLLHQPAFQRLEALWRAVHRILVSVEDEASVFLLDVSRQELAADLAGNPESSGLYQRLSGGEAPWSLIAADEGFGPDAADVTLLSALGAIAAQIGAPFLAAADAQRDWKALAGDEAERWQALRRSPQARALGLALPRWLLRLPYGPKTDPIEAFPFDELGTERNPASYLWGNPAFACVWLALAAFREKGEEMELGDVLEIDDLPAHSYREDGESRLQPCAELVLSEAAIAALLGRGLMPLASARDRNAVRLARFQSLADPPAPLIGPWQ